MEIFFKFYFQLKVCDKFDEKEELFRNIECLLTETTQLQVLHQWKPFFGMYNITFVFLNGQNWFQSYETILLNNNNTIDNDHLQLLYRSKTSLSKGVWKLIILNDHYEILGMHRFMIFPVNINNNVTLTSNKPTKEENNDNLNNNFKKSIYSIMQKYPRFFSNNLINNFNEFWWLDRICIEPLSNNHKYNLSQSLTNCKQVNWNLDQLRIRFML